MFGKYNYKVVIFGKHNSTGILSCAFNMWFIYKKTPEHQTEFDSVQNLTVKQSRISKKFIEISYHVDVYNTQAKFSLNTIYVTKTFLLSFLY